MKKTYVAVGALLSIVSYFWYRYVINNANIFDVFYPDLFSRPQFLPMVLGAIGVIILIVGLIKEDMPIRVTHANQLTERELQIRYADR